MAEAQKSALLPIILIKRRRRLLLFFIVSTIKISLPKSSERENLCRLLIYKKRVLLVADKGVKVDYPRDDVTNTGEGNENTY